MANSKIRNQVAGLCDFLLKSPTPYHAVEELAALAKDQGFSQLREEDAWKLKPGGSYWVERGGSSFIAFKLPSKFHGEEKAFGFKMVGAHTDSPCLKLKPQPGIVQSSCLKSAIEIYGGVLLSTWFDRDLALAGRVVYEKNGKLESKLIDSKTSLATLPNLAIHLNREVNDKRSIQKQQELFPIWATADKTQAMDQWLSAQAEGARLLSYDLSFYDVQKPSVIGVEEDFLASAKIDNLLSTFLGLRAFLDSEAPGLYVSNDHEEIGSQSNVGACGNFLKSVLQRIYASLGGTLEDFYRGMQSSLLISTDNAHAVHPNYADRHDPQHSPKMNYGPVLKTNVNQRYATSDVTRGLFASLCEKEKIPFQHFVSRNDMLCGSTIGPLTATELGVRTLDLGAPTWGMHSIREVAGVKDIEYLYQALRAFYVKGEVSCPV